MTTLTYTEIRSPLTMNISPKVRKYIYGIVLAVLPLLVVLGAIDEGISAQVALIAAAVLGMGEGALALSKVEKAPDAEPDLHDPVEDGL